jgi:predicted thioesterase
MSEFHAIATLIGLIVRIEVEVENVEKGVF